MWKSCKCVRENSSIIIVTVALPDHVQHVEKSLHIRQARQVEQLLPKTGEEEERRFENLLKNSIL